MTDCLDERALIFSNLLNGCSIQQVAQVFHKTESEINYIFSFVLRKVKSYCFLRSTQRSAVPMVIASNLEEARRYRMTCLSVLPKLNLEKAPQFKDIHHEVVNPDNAMQVMRNLNT